MVEFIYEKAFRDRGSGFVYYPINCRTTGTQLVPREIKINLVAYSYLIISKHNIHVNINK